MSVIYSLHIKDTVQQVAALMYAGSGVAAVFVGDLVSLFVFWEATAITSVFLIWARRTERAYATGMRYLLIQVGSGVLLLAGTIIHYRATGSLAFGAEAQPVGLFAFDDIADASPGIVLIFLSFGIKAAFPLLHKLVAGRLPRSHDHRHRLALGLHDQARYLRTGARIRRHRPADSHWRRDDGVPRSSTP